MAINPETKYPGKIAPSTSDYPYGAARNVTVPGDGTGTPWEAGIVNDLLGFQQALLSAAAIVPSGTPDNANISQYLQAVRAIISGRTPSAFADEANMAVGTALDGSTVSFFEGQALKVNGEGDSFTCYTVVTTSADVDLGGGLWAKKLFESSSYNLIPVRETKVFQPEKALFAFHFDGPYISNLTALLDKADDLGVKVCVGSIIDLTNGAYGGQNENANYGYIDQLVDAARRGHEIYNHGTSSSLDLSPGTTVSESLQDYWINYSHDWLQKLGINAQMWVTSNGKPVIDQTPHLDPKYIPKILEKHSVAFGRTSSPWNDPDGFQGASFGADTPVNEEGLTRANIEGASQAQIEAFIDYCIANRRVAVFAGHDSGNGSQLTVAEFEAAVNYIHAQGYEVTTSQDVFASFTNLFSDNGTTAKAANSAALIANTVIEENLLTTTDLTYWTKTAAAGIGTTVLAKVADDRIEGEQFTLTVSDPTIVNSTCNLDLVINRPFNTQDMETLCSTIGFNSSDITAFGVQCVIQFFDDVDAGGALIKTFGTGGLQTVAGINEIMSTVATNLFSYSNCQSMKIRFEIANKITWAGAKVLNLFNPRVNRGNTPAVFRKKRGAVSPLTAWQGAQASVGTITLDQPVTPSSFVKVEVGVNNLNQDVRGSELFAYNTHDNRTIRAWSSGGAIYTDFVVRFNSPTELEVLSETPVGGGDFAVIGVYRF